MVPGAARDGSASSVLGAEAWPAPSATPQRREIVRGPAFTKCAGAQRLHMILSAPGARRRSTGPSAPGDDCHWGRRPQTVRPPWGDVMSKLDIGPSLTTRWRSSLTSTRSATRPFNDRIPLPRSSYRSSHARPRRPPPGPTGPNQTPTDQSVGPNIWTACLTPSTWG